MYGLLRASLLMNFYYRMSFFSRGNNGINNRDRGNWNIEGLDFPSILMLIPKN
jgi:hypothetical protein